MNGVTVQGMVLSSAPVGEYDNRVVILTTDRGKISAFARGARRQGNPLAAFCRPFATGLFTLYEGRTAYTLKEAKIQNYFEEVTSDMEKVSFGYYFVEFADYGDSSLTNYKFNIIVDDKPYQAIYWKAYDQVSVHDESSCICNPFDTYHNKIAVDIIKDLIKKL